MTKLRSLTSLFVCVCLNWAAPAHADVVSDWNAVTLLYVYGNPPTVPVGRGGPPGLLDLALVQTAVHDAVQAIEGRFEPYHYTDPTKLGVGSPAAAVAAAAHRVLVLLYPGQQGPLDTFYNNYLTANGLGGDPGLAVGEAAAVALHTNHYRPVIPLAPFFGRTNPGEWRSATPLAFLYLAVTDPFTLNRPSQFRPQPPPPLTSRDYAREYDEVKALGRSSAHPNSQTEVAHFWTVNFFAQWNEALRQIADAHLTNVGDSARLFALANLAAADTAIGVWESKYFFNFWRPDMAIQEGVNDGNAKTAGDMTWTPLLANPPYPDYVSGANGLTGAITGMLQLFFGTDEMNFSVKTTSPLVSTPERFYSRFSDAAQEVVEARILLGIHFRAADDEARRLGNRVAHWIFMRYLRPVPGSKRRAPGAGQLQEALHLNSDFRESYGASGRQVPFCAQTSPGIPFLSRARSTDGATRFATRIGRAARTRPDTRGKHESDADRHIRVPEPRRHGV